MSKEVLRRAQVRRRRGAKPSREVPSGIRSGFDFCVAIRQLGRDIVARTPALSHIDFRRIAIVFAQARKRVSYGLFASLTPLRFQHGSLTTQRHGRTYTIQRLFDPSGVEYLYILTFYLPRFQDLDLREKLVTIFHELWHISPAFDGDIRRHPGRCYAHTGSQAQYDAHMELLVDAWLAQQPPETLWSFLKLNFNELQRRWGRVTGVKIARPRLIPS